MTSLNLPLDNNMLISIAAGFVVASAVAIIQNCCARRVNECVSKLKLFDPNKAPTGKISSHTIHPPVSPKEFLLRMNLQGMLKILGKSGKLISAPKILTLLDRTQIKLRTIEAKGDCFFLSYAVSLLEFIHENKEAYKPLASKIGNDELLSLLQKQTFLDILKEVKELTSPKDLETIFADKDKMRLCAKLLRILMASALDKLDDIAVDEDGISKETIYTDYVGSLDPEDVEKWPEFEPEHFKDLQNLLINHRLWPSDTMIRELFLKMGKGLCISKYTDEGLQPLAFDMNELGVQQIGQAFLIGEHYMNTYPIEGSIEGVDLAMEERFLLGSA